MHTQITPLHRAVIEGIASDVEKYVDCEDWRALPDPLGFTPLELAQFLGNDDCIKLLGGSPPKTFFLQDKNEESLKVIALESFEKIFGVTYRSFLTFSSYQFLKEVVSNCPYILRSPAIATENHQWAKRYRRQLQSHAIAPVCIKWIDDFIGYGLFADADIKEGTFIGEYTGRVRRLFRRQPDHNAYCLHYPTRFWSLKYFVVDALKEGNLMRFINHSDRPNIQPLCLVDRGLLRQVFVANRVIGKGSQLIFDYGKDYWIKRVSSNLDRA